MYVLCLIWSIDHFSNILQTERTLLNDAIMEAYTETFGRNDCRDPGFCGVQAQFDEASLGNWDIFVYLSLSPLLFNRLKVQHLCV